MFVIKRSDNFMSFEYYEGEIYKHQGQIYAVCTNDPDEAKKYSSRARAVNAANTLTEKCGYIFEAEELK